MTRPTSALRNDHPVAFYDSTDLSCSQRSSSCILRLDRPQFPATIVQLHSMTRPTSAARNDHPVAFYDSTDLSFPLRSSSCILRFNRQLPASNIYLYLHDSTYARYPHRTSSCAHLRLDHSSYRHHRSC